MTLRFVLVTAAFVLGITVVVIASVQSRTDHRTPPISNESDLASFADFPVFWLGSEYGGYKLDRVIWQRDDRRQQPFVLTYGSCALDFERGCVPPIVVKTIPRCWPEPAAQDAVFRIRDRAAAESPHLTLEAGDGSVVIYAEKSLEMQIARDLVVANSHAFPQYAQVKSGDSLPGSLCELSHAHPRTTFPPSTPDSSTTNTDPHASTVIASLAAFGGGDIVETYGAAERKLGWKPLRNDDPRFTAGQNYGIGNTRTFKNPLPSFEQIYDMIERTAPIMIRQEPESYPDFKRLHTSQEQVGTHDTELWKDYGEVGAVFWSGESVNGQRIRVVLSAPASDGYTLDDIREFVRTLSVG